MLWSMTIRGSKFPQLDDESWVRSEYCDKRRSCADIAAELGCSTALVDMRVRYFQLPRRGRWERVTMPARVCERCGSEYVPVGQAQKYCSLECRPGLRTCERPGCETTFKPKPPQHRSGKDGSHTVYPQKYCSLECRKLVWAQQSRDRQAMPTLFRRATAQGYVEVNVGA